MIVGALYKQLILHLPSSSQPDVAQEGTSFKQEPPANSHYRSTELTYYHSSNPPHALSHHPDEITKVLLLLSQIICNFLLSHLLHTSFCFSSSKAFLLCSLRPSVQISYPHMTVIIIEVPQSEHVSVGRFEPKQGEYITVVHH